MQIVIEMPQEVIEKDAEGYFNYFGCMSKTLYETLKNGTVLPNDSTNGDVIEALFPNTTVHIFECLNSVNVITDETLNAQTFDLEWWNAPYETESEG